ncbi:hypothetical protein QYE76_015299 [Lolium multiflorum]|uniref:C3H1-type domain-containing protein n=1 Tax=Lolium multiflorum TaxID=4521 RepID=A0AAD8U4N0_LOLMU|nr:hypothetical protein QYE76_015299 [Lolium multiflorum]
MQEVLLPAHPVPFGFGFGPTPLGFVDRRLCSPALLLPTGDGLIHGGCSPFTPNTRASPPARGDGVFYRGCTPFTPSPMASPRGHTPSPRSSPRAAASVSTPSSSGSRVYDDTAAAAATEHRLRMARFALQYQDAVNRYHLCVSQLADAAREADALRLHNAGLRGANNDLAGRVVMLGGNRGPAIALAGQLRRLHLGPMQPMPGAPPMLPMACPASPGPPMLLPMARPAFPGPPMLPIPRPASQGPPMLPIPRPASQGPPMLPMARPASPAEKHAVLPKSISIRSTGYLKMARNGGSGKHRVTKPENVGSQRVFVGVDGAKPEEQKGQLVTSTGGLEFEVYNQGMFKTELCNNWEETGACRYADQCQFAHGIAELRPIIRHPRYKTQVCRMIIGGALCPYGHRCHFRHSITPADHPLLLAA